MSKCVMSIDDLQEFLNRNMRNSDEEYGIIYEKVVEVDETTTDVSFLATGPKQIKVLAQKTKKWMLTIDGTYNLNVEGTLDSSANL